MDDIFSFICTVQMEMLANAGMMSSMDVYTDTYARDRTKAIWLDIEDDFRLSYGRKIKIKQLETIDYQRLLELGFRPNVAGPGSMLLIPLWLINYIADGETLMRPTDGGDDTSVIKVTDDFDFTPFSGCVSYGFYHPSRYN